MAWNTEEAAGPTELPMSKEEAAEKRAEAERKGTTKDDKK